MSLTSTVFLWVSIILIGYWPAILLAAWFTVKHRNTIRRRFVFFSLGSIICGITYFVFTFVPSRLLQHYGLFKQLSLLLLVATVLGLLLGFWLLRQLAKWKVFSVPSGNAGDVRKQ